MKYKTRTLQMLEQIQNKVTLLNKNAKRNVPFSRDEFVTFTDELVNRIDEVIAFVELENDDNNRYVDNLV